MQKYFMSQVDVPKSYLGETTASSLIVRARNKYLAQILTGTLIKRQSVGKRSCLPPSFPLPKAAMEAQCRGPWSTGWDPLKVT